MILFFLKKHAKDNMWTESKLFSSNRDFLVPFENADKDAWHEKWELGRGILDFPHPWRALLTGPPGTGKSTTVKNILIRATPAFERLIIIHADPENTKEYNDVKVEGNEESVILVSEIPDPTCFEEETDENGESFLPKTLLIIDDLDLRSLNREQKRRLDRLLGYVSTHRSVSVAVCTQDAFNLPPACRRMISLYVLWRSPDMEALAMLAAKVGVKNLQNLFDTYCKGRRDSIWIDTSVDTPAPLRLNGFTILKS